MVETLLHEPILEADTIQVFHESFCPFPYRFRYVHAIEAKLGFNPVLDSGSIADHLPATANHLTMAALFFPWNKDPLEQSLGKKMRKFSAILAVCFYTISSFLGNKARGSDQAFHTMLDQSIVQPETETSRLVDYLDCTLAIAMQKQLKGFPSAWDAPAPKLHISGPDCYVPSFLV